MFLSIPDIGSYYPVRLLIVMKPRSTRTRAAIELSQEVCLFADGDCARETVPWFQRRHSLLRAKHIGTGRRTVLPGTSLSLVTLEFMGSSRPTRIFVEVVISTEWTSNLYLDALFRSINTVGIISIHRGLFNGTWYNTANDIHFLFEMSCFHIECLLIDSYAMGHALGGNRIHNNV